jgi:hypothetical protein
MGYDYKNKKMTQKSKLFTLDDEAPLLATYSFLPIVKHLPQQQVLKWKLKTSLWLPEFYPISRSF